MANVSGSTKPSVLGQATLVPLGFVIMLVGAITGGVWQAAALNQRVDNLEVSVKDDADSRRRLWEQTRENAEMINDVRESTARTEGQLDGISEVLRSIERRVESR